MRNTIVATIITGFVLAGLLFGAAGTHPSLLITVEEAKAISAQLGQNRLLDQTFNAVVAEIDVVLANPIEVPQPGEAGGYEHEKHKQNYREMKKAGLLFQITGNEKYAEFVKAMLLEYATMYPDLGPHPLSHKQKPGKLFHQMLNEAVWLVNVSQAYDCVYNWLSKKDRKMIEKNIFDLMVEWFTVENAHEFDRIHNHGTWSAASVGMIGYVLGNQDWINMALYGTNGKGEGGFIKQLDLLFAPDGYYMEGPYYVRYALRPFLLFAEVIERNQPELQIYEYRNQIIKKAFYSAIHTSYPNGVFPPINDASRTMNMKAPGLVMGTSLIYSRYDSDPSLLSLAKYQQQVMLNGNGLKLAGDYTKAENIADFTWTSVEFLDGYDGNQGGLGILRSGSGRDQTVLLMKYGVHGLGHGHFDKLHFIYYDQEREVIPDYGFVRWVNIEPKFGGRYLSENTTYGKQTIAHNTVVVDQTSQNNFNRKEADKVSGKRHFFDADNPQIQVMSARADVYYPGVEMQRTMFLITPKGYEYPLVVDLYRLESDTRHEYDYPLHYNGQLISVDMEYKAFTSKQKTIGDNYGYQHLWLEAEGKIDDGLKFTWLDGSRYYSIVTSGNTGSQVLFGRIGANDPNFNLRPEPVVIMRREASDHLFASVIHPHGFFSEAGEISRQANTFIESVNVIGHSADGSVIEIHGDNDLYWRIMVNNSEPSDDGQHKLTFNGKDYEWTGNYYVDLDAK